MVDNKCEYSNRMRELSAQLRALGADAFMSYKPNNRLYLSGFGGSFGYVLVSNTRAVLATDFRYAERAAKLDSGYEIVTLTKDYTVHDLIKSMGIRHIAVEEDHMSVVDMDMLKKNVPAIEIIYGSDLIRQMRAIKSEQEIECIRKACAITDKVFDYFVNYIRPGLKETDVIDELSSVMKKFGAERPLFMSLVSGAKTSMPHGAADEKEIMEGDFVTLDMGAVYCGYGSDMTRTVVMGEASEEQHRIYSIVLEAQLRALDAIRPGITGFEVDRVARSYIEEMGYGQCFGHGLGHGVGMDLSDMPRLTNTSLGNCDLRKNMVATDEPGIYIANFGGVRIEDTVLITENGVERLTLSPKLLIEIKNK